MNYVLDDTSGDSLAVKKVETEEYIGDQIDETKRQFLFMEKDQNVVEMKGSDWKEIFKEKGVFFSILVFALFCFYKKKVFYFSVVF